MQKCSYCLSQFHANDPADVVNQSYSPATRECECIDVEVVRNECDLPNLLHSHHDAASRAPLKPLIAYEEAEEIIANASRPLEIITMEISEKVCGFVCADSIVSDHDVPAIRTSIVDGFAVNSKNLKHARVRLVDQWECTSSDCAMSVTTGDAVPCEADCVVMIENTTRAKQTKDSHDIFIDIDAGLRPGSNIREFGSDVAIGECILQKGSIISASGDLSTLLLCWVKGIRVVRKARVAILTISEEGECDIDRRLINANHEALKGIAQNHGFECVCIGIYNGITERDEQGAIKSMSEFDVLITVGGLSPGKRNLLANLFDQINAKVRFAGVNIKPGKPFTFSTIQSGSRDILVFSLPSNPVSVVVGFRIFVLDALKRMSGTSNKTATLHVMLEHDIILDTRPEFHRVLIHSMSEDMMCEFHAASRGVAYSVTSTGSQRSFRTSSLQGVKVLVKLPASSSECRMMRRGQVLAAIVL